MEIEKIETKLAAARTKLILDKPFLGALVLRLPMVAADDNWCPTTATDARKFYYNPKFIESLSMPQTQFMLAHEALHCALSHFARRQHRIKHRWDIACDYAINPLLIEDGLTPPSDVVYIPEYLGMTAEEIYPLLDDNDDSETFDKHMYDQENESGGGQQGKPPEKEKDSQEKSGEKKQDGKDVGEKKQEGAGQHEEESQKDDTETSSEEPKNSQDSNLSNSEESNRRQDSESTNAPPPMKESYDAPPPLKESQNAPPPLNEQERETLDIQWQQRLAGAAQQAMQSGKMGGSIARLVDHLLQPQLPWRMLLARYVSATARDDFSFMRPSRREGEAILPSLRSSQVHLIIAIDTSGSIKTSEMDAFLSEISALKGQMRARITLMACDTEIAKDAPWYYEPWEDFDCPVDMFGGGGTDFRPVFNWVSQQCNKPELLVYFTDAEGLFPKEEPDYPVIWLVKGKEKVPWGQRIQLN